jgi:putative intracellular protease/amidase
VYIQAHPLPFGGLALVPVSDAGRDWLESVCDGFAGVFLPGLHACMTGFPADAIGFEPKDWPDIVRAARDAGLTVEGV